MHDIFFRGRKVKHSDESVLPVKKKEGKGKENGPSALGCKIDAQTCVRFLHTTFALIMLSNY